MALSSYNDLKTSVADWLNRADIADRVPDFIEMATSRLQREMARVRHPSAISKAVATFTTAYAPLPLDWIQNYQLMTDTVIAEYVSPHETEHLIAENLRANNRLYYTIVGTQMRLFPTPAVGSPVSLTLWYYAQLAKLTDTNQTNWLLQRYPDLYLYASLVHSAPYLKGDERLATWETIFQKLLSEIEIEADRATRSQSHLRKQTRSF